MLCGHVEACDAIRNGTLVMPFGPQLSCPSGYDYRLVSMPGRKHSKQQIQFRDWVIETARKFRASLAEIFAASS